MTLPVSMGPIQLTPPKPKRRWRLLVVWTLLVFAGGVAAGPYLIEQASGLVERGFAATGIQAPAFIAKKRAAVKPVVEPLPDKATPVAPTVTPTQPSTAGDRAAQPVAAVPQLVAPQIEKIADTQAPVLVAAGREVGARHASPKVSERPAPSKPAVPAPAAKKKSGSDPFDTDSEAAPVVAAAPAAKKGKGAAPSEEQAPARRAEPSKSDDPLDSLMAGGVADNNTKNKKRDSKEIDEMLKDVQKGNAEPAPKKEPQASLPPLSAADISRVMSGVKSRGSECAQKTGQRGTAELKITVGKDGRVSDVRVAGKLAGTPAGECIDRVTRAATFPASAGLRFDYRVDVR